MTQEEKEAIKKAKQAESEAYQKFMGRRLQQGGERPALSGLGGPLQKNTTPLAAQKPAL